MGYIRHHAIIVTGWDDTELAAPLQKAIDLGLTCTAITPSPVDGYASFLIVPDGSKEGWGASNDAEKARADWVAWMRSRPTIFVNWIMVAYGGDDPEESHVVDHDGKQPKP